METQDTRSKTAVENELLENQYVSMMINDFKRRVFWGDKTAKPNNNVLIKLLIKDKMTIAEVSEMLGRNPATITVWMDEFGIKKSDHMDMLGERIAHMYTSGKTVSEISRCLSLSIATVKKHLKSKNLPKRY